MIYPHLQGAALAERMHPRHIIRFLKFVRVSSDLQNRVHWYWTGSRNEDGYGHFRLNGKTYYAHRLAYATFIGPIADGMQVNHKKECLASRCVLPEHLELVTAEENREDRWTRYHAAREGGAECPF